MHSKFKVIALLLLLVWAKFCYSQELAEDIYKKALPSVMTLIADQDDGKRSIGTGFMTIKDGIAVTAWHVVRNSKKVTAKFSNGEAFDVSGLIDKDEKRDVALIRVKVFGRNLLPLMPSDPAVGSKVFAIGAPRGLEFSLSDGLVSQIQTIDGVKQYQFTSAVSPGNSGGPLINNKGEVIGVVAWGIKDGQNLNFAVPISYVMGLDSSLPTQPWQSVKPSDDGPSQAGTVSNDIFDKIIAESLLVLGDGYAASVLTNDDVLIKPFGFRSGVPGFLYQVQQSVSDKLKQLNSTVSGDAARERIREYYRLRLDFMVKHLDYTIQGIKISQQADKPTPEANDLMAKASSVHSPNVEPLNPDDLKILHSSKAFINALPYDYQVNIGALPGRTGINLGVPYFPKNPLYLVSVPKNSYADKIGLRSKDRLISYKDKPFQNQTEFKQLLVEFRGGKIKVKILRDNKEKDIELKIPE